MAGDMERTMAFIDGANFFATAKQLGFDVDYSLLLHVLKKDFRLIRVNYYTAVYEDEDSHIKIRPLIDWLSYNGYTVISKPAKVLTTKDGETKIKGNMDVEIAVHALEAASYADHILLFTGDGDFAELVVSLQRKGVRVTVISSIKIRPPMCADLLRKQADHFIDLDDWQVRLQRQVLDNTKIITTQDVPVELTLADK